MAERHEIPIVDFAGVRAHDPAAMRMAAQEAHRACTGVGFFYISGHGVPGRVIERAAAAARRFFGLPPEIKSSVAANANHRGYHAIGDALMYGARKPDAKEFYSIGLELSADDPNVRAGEPLRGPNNWPSSMPELRPALYGYYEEMAACGADLLRVVALSLGLDETFFETRYTKPLQRTQIIHYPPQPPVSDADQFGVAPHSDYGCITLLWQDDNGGLQVRNRSSGTWIDAAPIPGTLVVNVGDLLARWTNDRFSSTPHRVINRSGRDRYSIATFVDPNFATVIDPRDLGTADADCRYEPVRTGDYILGRFDQSFGYRKKLATPAQARN
ncbi:MAG TPA: 2-oxoglutarate and iron-dependent oxygenase domain-containing protein [Stellaceae bacterium]|nr:2-oxoglutarate and iron-dependent oxygenase domain-containing protein [Stellaceae bacterium]